MTQTSYRQTYATIELSAIAYNTRTFKKLLAENCQLMAVVKGNGYGHGAVPVAKEALEHGATYLGVAIIDEAVELREAGITAPILVLGYTPPEAFSTAINKDITITLFDKQHVQSLGHTATTLQKQANVHLKVDTGMGRIGMQSPDQLVETAKAVHAHPSLHLEGIFTHFAEADCLESRFTNEQYSRFCEFLQAVEAEDMTIPIKHCCNSAGALYHPEKHMDMVRVGISLYGLRPDTALTFPVPLQQAMHVYAMVAAVRSVHKGETISYGRTHMLENDRKIATLAIGYADGLSRALSNKGYALLSGQQAPILGRVCMDQTMIDVTDINGVQPGDVVEFSIDHMADSTDTINYEIVCALTKRVPRYYKKTAH
ncbi:alanine racemase [Shouchella hunanensis]|uniref:Alanine racemase n=1 Tax=Shouchella hunanensis TaxID=766894 RepID=A0ABY7W3V2_9BACI|nr:alanine racemase [Shouchella hunanensis]WDF02577.1 alanine racemase [Shouchella hunanensis]